METPNQLISSRIIPFCRDTIKVLNNSLGSAIEQFNINDVADACYLCLTLTIEYDESHDYLHHYQVLKNALEIIRGLNIENNLSSYTQLVNYVIYSCLLHDVVDPKYSKNLKYKDDTLNSFLQSKLGDDWVSVRWIIDNMSYSKEKKNGYPTAPNDLLQLARNICSDADKLEALGENGLKRCYQYNRATYPSATEQEITQFVVDHCKEKLLHLKDRYIRTSVGKLLAEKGHSIIEQYVREYN